jgi:hypothetical protein
MATRTLTGRRILITLACLFAFATSASAECGWALWAYQTNSVGFDVIRDLQAAFSTLEECLAFGAGWAEKMQQRTRNDPASKALTWSWSCASIPETLMENTPRHPVR